MTLQIRRVEQHVARLDAQVPAVRHRIARVHDQVDQHLLDLPAIHLHQPQFLVGDDVDDDVLAEETAEDRLDVADQRVEVEDLQLLDLPAAEREQLTRQRGAVRGGFLDRFEIGAAAAVGRQFFEQQLAEADDRRQQIVEIVRDTAGEPADALHLLRLAELAFEAAAFGDIASRQHQLAVRLAASRSGSRRSRRARAIRPGDGARAAPAIAPSSRPRESRARTVRAAAQSSGCARLPHRSADQLLRRDAEHARSPMG